MDGIFHVLLFLPLALSHLTVSPFYSRHPVTACLALANIVKSSLGPVGLAKRLVSAPFLFSFWRVAPFPPPPLSPPPSLPFLRVTVCLPSLAPPTPPTSPPLPPRLTLLATSQ
jgi:hypothetical protein